MLKHFFTALFVLTLGLFVSLFSSHFMSEASDDFAFSLEPASQQDYLLTDIWESESEPYSPKRGREASVLFSLDSLEEVNKGPKPLPERSEAWFTPQRSVANSDEGLERKGWENALPTDFQSPIAPPTELIAAEPALGPAPSEQLTLPPQDTTKRIKINFNNVSIIEYIRFISRISNKNFIFDEGDLQFNVTIVSEEPTSLENIMMALIQELRIHDLTLIEQGNNLIIHKNLKVNNVSKVVAEDIPPSSQMTEIVTQVFRLNTLDPARAASIIRPLVSDRALVEPLPDTNHLIVTDIVSNVQQISDLLKSLDAPSGGLVIGQYVARAADIDTLLPLVQKLMQPIAQGQQLTFVPYVYSNSIFIVSTPFLVEQSISILQHLDQEQGITRIIEPHKLQYQPTPTPSGVTAPYPGVIRGPGAAGAPEELQIIPFYPTEPLEAGWDFGPFRNDFEIEVTRKQELERARTGVAPTGAAAGAGAGAGGAPLPPIFIPEIVPPGAARAPRAAYPPPLRVGVTVTREEEAAEAPVEVIKRPLQINEGFAPVPVNRQKFYIHKLQYRTGDVILGQIQSIGTSLQNTTSNAELLATINSIQWLQPSKALVITGTPENIDKMRELIDQLDIPLRQVFIEMLILQTSLDDSLDFGVDWASRFGGGNQAGSMGFQEGASPLQGTMDSTGVTGLGGIVPIRATAPGTLFPFNNALVPDPRNLAKTTGFNLGVIGQHIIHKGLGLQFNSIGALVFALHDLTSVNVVMCPNILVEDGVAAQIFVGVNTPFKTQSVSNDLGSIITNNFEFRDVGTSLQVTPHLGNGDIVALDIIEEFSSLATTPVSTGNSNNVVGPTTNKNSTRTSLLVPDGYFVILSGMMQDETDGNRSQVPCLGNIPLAGAAFARSFPQMHKRNLMIFLRPQIIDTDEQLQNITRHQQDIWKIKNTQKPMWLFETENALDYFNVRKTQDTDDNDDLPCREFVH